MIAARIFWVRHDRTLVCVFSPIGLSARGLWFCSVSDRLALLNRRHFCLLVAAGEAQAQQSSAVPRHDVTTRWESDELFAVWLCLAVLAQCFCCLVLKQIQQIAVGAPTSLETTQSWPALCSRGMAYTDRGNHTPRPGVVPQAGRMARKQHLANAVLLCRRLVWVSVLCAVCGTCGRRLTLPATVWLSRLQGCACGLPRLPSTMHNNGKKAPRDPAGALFIRYRAFRV